MSSGTATAAAAIMHPREKSQLRARSPSPFAPMRGRRKSLPRSSSALAFKQITPLSNGNGKPSGRAHVRSYSDDVDVDADTDFWNEKVPSEIPPRARTPFGDVEAQRRQGARGRAGTKSIAAEYEVATRTKAVYLAGWFALNLLLTIYNKALLQDFHFPWLLTTIHATCVSAGCYSLLAMGHFKLTKLGSTENLVLVAFSVLFTMNIAVSNVSLAAVSVPFHQTMRSTCPVFTIVIHRVYYGRTYSTATYAAVVPIVLGVALATYGDYYFTVTGFWLTLLGVILASVKTVVSNRLMTGGLALPALEILLRMSPLAAMQAMVYAWLTGESARFLQFAADGHLPLKMVAALLGNGILAFVLNVSSFQTNKLSGALTLTVAGNLKQCLTILLGIVLFQVKVGLANGLGMIVSILGAAWYSKVELDSKGKK